MRKDGRRSRDSFSHRVAENAIHRRAFCTRGSPPIYRLAANGGRKREMEARFLTGVHTHRGDILLTVKIDRGGGRRVLFEDDIRGHVFFGHIFIGRRDDPVVQVATRIAIPHVLRTRQYIGSALGEVLSPDSIPAPAPARRTRTRYSVAPATTGDRSISAGIAVPSRRTSTGAHSECPRCWRLPRERRRPARAGLARSARRHCLECPDCRAGPPRDDRTPPPDRFGQKPRTD